MTAMPETDLKIVRATVRGVPNMVAVLIESLSSNYYPWFTPDDSNWHREDHVTDRVPLDLVDRSQVVVLDPDSQPDADALAAAVIEACAHDGNTICADNGIHPRTITRALRSLLETVEPLIPPEPEGDDWIAEGRNGAYYPAHQENGYGYGCWSWEELNRHQGPLKIYRRSES
jgi:hypothetical protein